MDFTINEGEKVLLFNWINEQKTKTDKCDSIPAAENSPQK